jgi:molybdopterin molybdotransferase
MHSYEEALASIAAIEIALGHERVPLAAAAGRVLAAPVRLTRDQPPFDRACLDGWAVRGDGPWRVVGSVAAGAPAPELATGTAVRISTGATVPSGGGVLPLEIASETAGVVSAHTAQPIAPGANTARRGEDGAAGAIVVAPGTRLTPAVLAAAAMAGAVELDVYAAPRVALLTTGDEVGRADAAGIADSNGPLLIALGAALGLPLTVQRVRDEAVALDAALAATAADLVITTGGVGPGARDLVVAAALRSGFATVFHGVDLQPGKPAFCAVSGRRAFLGLPGNPVSVLATAHLFLLPLLARCWPGFAHPWLELPLTAPARAGARRLFLPARFTAGGVAPLPWNGSGDLLAAAHGHALIDLPARSQLAIGTVVRVLPYVGGIPGAGAAWTRATPC